MDGEVWDYVIVGSGFGGAISAMRLAQKGYRVAVIEAGRRWRDQDFPKTNWDSKNYNWLPRLGWTGPMRLTLLRHVVAAGWAGVGGGSLMYGNTLFLPQDSFFDDPEIRKLGSRPEIEAYFDLASRMLGVTPNPRLYQPDQWIKETVQEYGRGHTFTPSPVAINFSEGNTDPYFGGDGPNRGACNFCGGCFLGCRENAKNTLEKNYLYFAEKLGAVIYPETEVCDLIPMSSHPEDGFCIVTRCSTNVREQWFGGRKTRVRAKNIVISAGVMGTLKLLLKVKRDRLPQISDQLGYHVMTNSEALVGVRVDDKSADLSRGVAASSSVFPDEHTQIQVDRYPDGANAQALWLTMMVDGGGRMPRFIRWVWNVAKHPVRFVRVHSPSRWARQTMILVVMQNLKSSLRVVLKGNCLGSKRDNGPIAPGFIPIANDFARRLAARSKGEPLTFFTEAWMNIPVTAHILGGCKMGDSVQDSVLDVKNRLHGFPNIIVCDGSVITTNLGVNPALSIAALTERAMSFIPPKTGATPRHFQFEHDWPEARVLFSAGLNNEGGVGHV
ncbi:MAG: cholesterol oxidase [Alphaproteobacteria bacterium HGW-Alphaproteobacteria-5]|nr:MAG: cholesterol oxidase [Alphaproteobacteria bacterium HGW-Alphaproteobacteria-5]